MVRALGAHGHSRRFARFFPMSGLVSTADVPDTMAIFAFGAMCGLTQRSNMGTGSSDDFGR